ncbi:hypothetical protein D9757_000936 [Collybiopsis confluens]|uniref:Solute carrier family 40 member n=1 Tax=Collybiopsis confluens TaxID=2823264 RepID=A0A8H5MG03_9AGAR|nr:hypothetical protein D9757_000936 [Collybiopsis confluens]
MFKVSGITLSHWAGSLVDKYPRLTLVRSGILVQKLSAFFAYISCAWMFNSGNNHLGGGKSSMTPIFALIVFFGCALHFSNIVISIAVERDWATAISTDPARAQRPGSEVVTGYGAITNPDLRSPSFEDKLSGLNTYLRQINLLCQLCAPLFVSFLSLTFDGGDSEAGVSLAVLSAISVISLVFEEYWIGVVYRRFPQLQHLIGDLCVSEARQHLAEDERESLIEEAEVDEAEPHALTGSAPESLARRSWWQRFKLILATHEWDELAHLPVFFSSLSISFLYITVLSFDGIMIGYLKMLSFSDALIAIMRGICVVTGLCGTALAHPLEKRIGTERAGNWTIWSMVFSLVPVVIALYVFAPKPESTPSGHPAMSLLGAALLFGGMALSRIGLWSFDLIQTKQLQTALNFHPKRNSLTALQYTMQNVGSLAKYSLTMIFWRPSQFRWAAAASFASVSAGAVMYMMYVKKTRGHVLHLDWVKKMF